MSLFKATVHVPAVECFLLPKEGNGCLVGKGCSVYEVCRLVFCVLCVVLCCMAASHRDKLAPTM